MTNSLMFLMLAAGWLTLPLIPALRELKKPSDASALDVFQGNAADAREGLHLVLPHLFANAQDACAVKLAEYETTLWSESTLASSSLVPHPHLVSASSLEISGCPAEVRSVHANSLTLLDTFAGGVALSAHDSAFVQPGSKFQILQAPLIQVLPVTLAKREKLQNASLKLGAVAGATYYELQGWWRASKGAQVAAGEHILGDVIVEGDFVVGEGAVIEGSVKATGEVTLAEGATVLGNVVATRVSSQKATFIRGSVIAEESVSLGEDSLVGTLANPASVVSAYVALRPNSRIYGGVTARSYAEVLPASLAA